MNFFRFKSASYDLRFKLCLILAIFALCGSIATAQITNLRIGDTNDPSGIANGSAIAPAFTTAGIYGLKPTDSSSYFITAQKGSTLTFLNNSLNNGIVTLNATPLAKSFSLIFADGTLHRLPSSVNLNGNFIITLSTNDKVDRNWDYTVNGIGVTNGATFTAQPNAKLTGNKGFLGIKIASANATFKTNDFRLNGIYVDKNSTANIASPLSINIERTNTEGQTYGIFAAGKVKITKDVDIKMFDKTKEETPGMGKYVAGITGNVNIESENINIYAETSIPNAPICGYWGGWTDNYSADNTPHSAYFNAKKIKITTTYTSGVKGNRSIAIVLGDGSKADVNYGANGKDLGNIVQLDGHILSIDKSVLNVNLTNKDSYLKGMFAQVNLDGEYPGTLNLLFSNNATWYVGDYMGEAKENLYYKTNSANVTFNGAVIDLAWKGKLLPENTRQGIEYRAMNLDDAILKATNTLVVNTDISNGKSDSLGIQSVRRGSDTTAVINVSVAADPLLKTYVDSNATGAVTYAYKNAKPLAMSIQNTGQTIIRAAGVENIVTMGNDKYKITPTVETISNRLSVAIYITGLKIEKVRVLPGRTQFIKQ